MLIHKSYELWKVVMDDIMQKYTQNLFILLLCTFLKFIQKKDGQESCASPAEGLRRASLGVGLT